MFERDTYPWETCPCLRTSAWVRLEGWRCVHRRREAKGRPAWWSESSRESARLETLRSVFLFLSEAAMDGVPPAIKELHSVLFRQSPRKKKATQRLLEGSPRSPRSCTSRSSDRFYLKRIAVRFFSSTKNEAHSQNGIAVKSSCFCRTSDNKEFHCSW